MRWGSRGEVIPKHLRPHRHVFLPGLPSSLPALEVSVSLPSPPVPLSPGLCALTLHHACPPQSTRLNTSKQNSWPRMELCTGLIMESSSKLSSKASAALLGLSKDSCECDSLKLCISRALARKGQSTGSGPHFSYTPRGQL